MPLWWTPAALGALFVVVGLLESMYPQRVLSYLDLNKIRVNGVPRTVGGVRAMGIIFTCVGGALVVVGILALLKVISLAG